MQIIKELDSFAKSIFHYIKKRRSVAQPGSAHAWGACGRWFKSSRSDHLPETISRDFFSPILHFYDGLR